MTQSLAPHSALISLLRSTGDAGTLPQPFAHDILLLECHVAGTGWRDLAEIEPGLQKGDQFILRREPENTHDTWAIKVLTGDDEHLGYIPRAMNETLARLLDAGKIIYAKLTDKNWKDDWLRLEVEIMMRDL